MFKAIGSLGVDFTDEHTWTDLARSTATATSSRCD